MDLEIKYEHGSMTVHVEEFLSMRSISKVKKLLKTIRCSYTPECEQQIKEFVQEQIEQFEQVQKEHSIYIEGYTQKVRYAEQQIRQTKHIISQIQADVSKLQIIRDSHRKNTKVWKDCNADVKKHRERLKEPRKTLKSQNEELKELYQQYIYEKSLVEMWGYQSVLTFEEWLEIKKKRDGRNMESSIANAIFR